MALSATTDWSKIRYIMFVIFFVSALLASTVATGLETSGKQKRQLFREHLLPEQGGKIPEAAFEPNRLAANKFSQHGFFSPDGFHLDQRHPDRHHQPKLLFPKTLKVHLYPDNRFVASPGVSHDLRTVDTTYLIREPVNHILYAPIKYYASLPFLPRDSLKIVRQYKHGRKNNYNEWNEVANDEFPSKVFKQLIPYLGKIHETD